VRSNYIGYAAQGFDGVWGGGEFKYNLIERIRRSINLASGNHANGVQFQQSNGGSIHDNILRHTFLVAYPTDQYTTWGTPVDAGHTTYEFNNLIYDTSNANCFDIMYLDAVNSTLLGTMNAWNNTVQCGPDPGDKLTFSGTVTVSGSAVTWASGDKFPYGLDPSANAGAGQTITLNGTNCTVLTVNSATGITLTASCGSSGAWSAFGTTASNGIPIDGTAATPGHTCGGVPCYTAVNIDNEHFITANSVSTSCTNTGGAVCNLGAHNITQSVSTANGQGYTIAETYAFSPTAGGNSTVGAGLNYTSSWPGGQSTSDTGYAITYNTSSHSTTSPARIPNARPSSAAWDSGAYFFNPGSLLTSPTPQMFADLKAKQLDYEGSGLDVRSISRTLRPLPRLEKRTQGSVGHAGE
jgi:hypothetical protein